MGTKNNPGEFDCYHEAGDDEPMFVLLARDRQAPALVERWAYIREYLGTTAPAKIAEARACAQAMRAYQKEPTS